MKSKFALLFILLFLYLFIGSVNYSIAQPNRGMKPMDKLALVIANNQYQYGTSLDAPVPRAKELKKVLETQGVDVIEGYNLDFDTFKKKLNEFAEQLTDKNNGYKAGLVFYLGHGFQIDGENYLIPIDANPVIKTIFKKKSIPLNDLLQGTSDFSGPRAIFLDACRNNPYKNEWNGDTKGGFTTPEAPRNTMIYYSIQKDQEVSDKNPYMRFLMEEIKANGCLGDMVKKVYVRINNLGAKQVPIGYGHELKDICFGTREEKEGGGSDDFENLLLPIVEPVEGGQLMIDCKGENCNTDEPFYKATIDGFYIGKKEITVKEYMAFVKATDSHYPEWAENESRYQMVKNFKEDNVPIVGISWEDAVAYCKWLSRKTGRTYRLPTEAEWEFAARGGNKSNGFEYAGSNQIGDVGWSKENSANSLHEVGQKQSNELGLHDMSGNVYEWCADWYDNYDVKNINNPRGPSDGSKRVVRGGSWSDDRSHSRVAKRRSVAPKYRTSFIGFRIVLEE